MTSGTADLRLAARTDGPRDEYRFRTADGVCSPGAFRDGALLALESLWDRDLGDLLCVAANYGVVGTVLGDAADSAAMTESSARAVRLCERNAAANGVEADVSLVAAPIELDGRFDTAVYVPKPYTPIPVGKQRIADALSLLRPDGTLYLVAAPAAGLARYRECLAELAGDATSGDARGDVELVAARRPAEFEPPTHVTPTVREASVDGTDLSLATVPGVFAASGLDHGTRLLAETVDVGDGDRVLDLCCGYGPLGAWAAETADCDVVLSDDDRRATRCAERTLAETGLDGAVVTADCTQGVADRTFDHVLCNPPTHAGDGVLSALFDGVTEILASDGRMSLVHHRALDLRPHLRGFGAADVIERGEEHVVIRATL